MCTQITCGLLYGGLERMTKKTTKKKKKSKSPGDTQGIGVVWQYIPDVQKGIIDDFAQGRRGQRIGFTVRCFALQVEGVISARS